MSDYQLSSALLLGLDETPMVDSLGPPVHGAIVEPFLALRERAAEAGFDLKIASGFRSFDRQLAIWNAKASGNRVLLDSDGEELEFSSLGQEGLIHAILRWSALPGASRHHWGSDIDVFDAAAVPADYRLQLTPAEVASDGPFGPLHDWLDEAFRQGRGEGFFRPYARDRGGIAPERWHLSYAPLAAQLERQLSPAVLAEALGRCPEFALREGVLARLGDLYQRYIRVPVEAYPLAYHSVFDDGESV